MEHVFKVSGMTCGHCEMAVQRAVLAVDSEAVITVDRTQNRVQIQSHLPSTALIAAIANEGYGVEAQHTGDNA